MNSLLQGDKILMAIQAKAARCERLARNPVRDDSDFSLDTAKAELRDAADLARRNGYDTLSIVNAVGSVKWLLA